MKECTQCKVPKPETDFRLVWGRATPQRMTECIECLRARQRDIYHRRQREKAAAPVTTTPDDEIHALNRAARSWRGPVNKAPLRNAA